MAKLKNIKKSHAHGPALTLDEFVEQIYLPHARARKRSWRRDKGIIARHISPRFGAICFSAIKSGDVEDWHNELLESGFARGSCNRFLAVFKTMCVVAENRGQLVPGASPCRGVRNFKECACKERYLTKEEGCRLMARLGASDDKRAKALQLIMLTGARKNEILKAAWDCVDFEHHTLRVPLSKSNRPRHITLSEGAMEILRGIKRIGKWVFPGRNPDKPLCDLFNFWNRIRLELDLGDVRIHDLRHTFASYLVNGGHSLYEVQKLLGHSDPRTTMRYAHLENEALKNATDEVEKILLPPAAAPENYFIEDKLLDTQKII